MAIDFIDLKTQYRELKDSMDARMRRVLEHGQYIMGPEVAELEERLAAFTGARNCITCASGTEALLISLMALGLKPGDEVITTPFTFVATAEVIVLLGGTPIFVDIEPETCNIDVSKIEAAITSRTRAILPVSLYGQPADMDEVNVIAERHRLTVIEDAAQSLGATYRGQRSCNLSMIGCTSFFPSKPLGCYGDGGAIFTSDDGLAQAMREIRIHGQERRYVHTRIGVGGRMDTLQCAVVLAKLDRFEWEIQRRQEIGDRYSAMFASVPQVRTLAVKPDRSSVYAQYTVRLARRGEILKRLTESGIPTAIHYPRPLHQQPAYAQHWRGGALQEAELAAGEVLSLPMHPYLEEKVQEDIVSGLRALL